MDEITFSKEESATMVSKLQGYMQEEMGVEAGIFAAEFLLDFVSKELGVYYYNRGLRDAQSVLTQKFEDISDALYQLEKVTEHSR